MAKFTTEQYRFCMTYKRMCKYAKRGTCSHKHKENCKEHQRFIKNLMRWHSNIY